MNETDEEAELEALRLRTEELEREVEELRRALADRSALSGILSVCAGCKRVRERDEWTPFEAFLSSRFDVDFSHGLCPRCGPTFGLSDG